MSNKLKLLPALVTLLAGACTSIITFLVHYEVKKALIILLIVLILFYILGTVTQRVIYKFELQIEKEEAERAEQEGKVVEKDIPAGEEQGYGTQEAEESAEYREGEDSAEDMQAEGAGEPEETGEQQ